MMPRLTPSAGMYTVRVPAHARPRPSDTAGGLAGRAPADGRWRS